MVVTPEILWYVCGLFVLEILNCILKMALELHMSPTSLIVISTIRRGVMPPCLALCSHLTSKQQLKGPAYCTSKKTELPPGTRAEQISLIKRWRDESSKAKPLPTSVSLLSPLKLQSRTRETNTIKDVFLCFSCQEIGRRHYLKLALYARTGTCSKSYKGKPSPVSQHLLAISKFHNSPFPLG